MDIADLAFSRRVGVQCEPAGRGLTVSLPAGTHDRNQLGFEHAGAKLVLAVAASGDGMLRQPAARG